MEEITSWQGKSVLVTGAAGFLGTWVTRTLAEEGAKVTGIIHRDPLPTGIFRQYGLMDQIEVKQGSTLDLEFLKSVLQTSFSAVIHVAAQAYMPLGRVIPHTTYEANVRGTWNLMEAIRLRESKTPVVLASSDCVYGEPDGNLCAEDSPLRGVGPYEVSKICAEQVMQSYWKAFGIPVGFGRCSNLYGEGDRELSRIVPSSIRCLLAGKAPVIKSNGLAIRDYLHVSDAAKGLILIARSIASGKTDQHCFNFSSQTPVNVIQIVEKLLQATGHIDKSPEILDQINKNVSRKEVSSARAREHLKWKPQVTLEEGLRRTYEWHRDYWPIEAGGS